MDPWVIIFVIGVVLLSVYWGYGYHQREMKKIQHECAIKHCQPEPFRKVSSPRSPRFSSRSSRSARPQQLRFITSSPAPPLPLSTMYSIRIGREVIGNGGPGDTVWDYDHARITGPRY